MAGLWWPMLVLGVAAFVVFGGLLWWALARRRGTAPPDGPPPDDHPPGRRAWLVGAGVVQPAILVAVTFGLTLAAMQSIPDDTPPEAMEVHVVAHRWWYEVRYPDHGVVTANEMRLPLDEPVRLTLSSADVVHSFWIPRLIGKTDMLPDGPTIAVVHADEAGTYAGRCAEFCGLQHTRMGFQAIVEDRADVEAWLDAQAEPAAAPVGEVAQRGQEVLLGSTCVECHTIAGTPADGQRGPDLTHLASRSTIAADTVANTPEQLEAWIRNPHDVKEGVDMPPSPLDPDDLAALVAYLEGLE